MSSRGIAFTADRELPVGSSIEISMRWPVALQNGWPLKIVVKGRIVRRVGVLVACTIERFAFRTEASASFCDLTSGLQSLAAT